MLRRELRPTAAVTTKLVEERAESASRFVDDLHGWREVARQPGRVDALVKLDIFARVEFLIEESDCVEDLPRICDRGALRRNKLCLVRVDVGTRIVTQAAAACGA